MLTFQREALADVRDEMIPLLQRHWEEIALNKDSVPLDPDWEKYDLIEKAGMFCLVTAREAGAMVGYASFTVLGNLHYRSLYLADGDVFWLAPEYRKGTAGIRLLKAAEQILIGMGVNKIVNKTKLHSDLGPLFEYLGYTAIERVYAKMVG